MSHEPRQTWASAVITHYAQRVPLHFSLFWDLTAYDYGVDNFHCMKQVFKVFDSNLIQGIWRVKYNQTVCGVTRDAIIDHRPS